MAKKKLINPKQIANDRCKTMFFILYSKNRQCQHKLKSNDSPCKKKVINIGDLRSGVISFNITSFKPKTESPNQ